MAIRSPRSRGWLVTAYTAQNMMNEQIMPAQWCHSVWTPSKMEAAKLNYLVFQLERCPDTGRRHVQLYCHFDSQIGRRSVQRRLGLPGAHCEKQRGTPAQAAAYCKKEESRIDGPWEYGTCPEQGHRSDLDILHQAVLEGRGFKSIFDDIETFRPAARAHGALRHWIQLREADALDKRYKGPQITLVRWQRQLIATLQSEEPKERRIFWIWSTTSSTGKSTLMRWIRKNCCATTGAWDLKDFLFSYRSVPAKIILFNLPRHQTLDDAKLKVLEALSDGGYLLSTKYESCEIPVTAHIVVFANVAPPHFLLPDRIDEIHVPEVPISELIDACPWEEPDLVCHESPISTEPYEPPFTNGEVVGTLMPPGS